jgi:hypothetical protein
VLSDKLVTLNNWTPHKSVPGTSTALAEKLYMNNLRRELLEGDYETKLFLDYEEYHDAEPLREKHRISGNSCHAAELLRSLIIGLGPEMAFKSAMCHGETPDGRYNMSFRPFLSDVYVPFTRISRLKVL